MKRIFLADGDALTVETSVLVKILDQLYRDFSRLERVGIYGEPKDIQLKSIEELKELKEHVLETAKVASAINPHYLAGLTLVVNQQAPIMRSVQKGELELLSPLEALSEIKTLVEHLQVTDCIFRCNHASNYLPLKATLPNERAMLISIIDNVITSNLTAQLRSESSRAL